MSVTGRTDFVVIDDESLRGGSQAVVAVGLWERVPITQGTKLARVGNG